MQTIKLAQFEGPLDSLLDLIEKEKLDITDVSLAAITEQYIAYFKSLPDVTPEMLADFLVIAAQLMLIKSKVLIPQFEVSAEEEKDITELKIRLAQLQILRNASKEISETHKRGICLHARNPHTGFTITFLMPTRLTIQEMANSLTQLISLLRSPTQLKKETLRVIVSLEERISELKNRFTEALQHSFSALVGSKKSRLDIVVTFLAILELTKQQFIKLHQPKHFDDIHIEKV